MVASTIVEPIPIEADRAAVVFAALADPVRLRILDLLGDTTRCVCEIRERVTVAPNLLSYHLRVLREAGLIEGHKRGRWIDYRVADDAATVLAGCLAGAGFAAGLERLPTPAVPVEITCS